MKRNEKTKKRIQLCGSLIRPLTIGEPAVYAAGGTVFRTSQVMAIHELATSSIRFETMNSHYHLLLNPYPAAVVCQFPTELAPCA